MARFDRVAARYAKAIAGSLQGDQAKIRSVAQELADFHALTAKSPDLDRVLSTEWFVETKRRQVIEDLSAKLKLSPETRKILLVLSNMRRLSALEAVTRKLHLLLLESSGTVPLEVHAASVLSAEEKDKVEKRFAKILGRKVEANYQVDPALIGGLRVTAGGRTYDGSLAGWLNHFEEQLVEGRL